ncbi:MAG: type II toxin-antitoxin system prevent-host-death family antitoxin [Verrucomicrobia bacterium]|nr:type II toxin-antitoxin system prevent-host-death family antitoxin [Verrucomicrobiota bacterium]
MTIALEQFQASCLDWINLVNRTGEELAIDQHGLLVAKLVPAPVSPPATLFGKLAEQTHVQGDIVSASGDPWEADA